MGRWVWGVGFVLILLIWFVLDPQRFLRGTVERPGELVRETSGRPAWLEKNRSVKFGVTEKKTGAHPEPSGLITGAGREVSGETLVRLNSAEAYRKFLAICPPGMVLGQIQALNSLRVKSGDWLANALTQTGGIASGNFYIRIPEMPTEKREKGDVNYRAVGKKALDLMGAGGVAETWGRGVKFALMDTPREGMAEMPGE